MGAHGIGHSGRPLTERGACNTRRCARSPCKTATSSLSHTTLLSVPRPPHAPSSSPTQRLIALRLRCSPPFPPLHPSIPTLAPSQHMVNT